ncbi:MAG: hypothetical protein LC667_09685 [Thioalkalivibrio sp.]|nr:hypothetical protein [Thioalkalivibrio sp.]
MKRKILETHPDFDESTLGFAKFSKFLSEAVERGEIVITKTENGSSEIALPSGTQAEKSAAPPKPRREEAAASPNTDRESAAASAAQAPVEEKPSDDSGPTVIEVKAPKDDRGLKLGPRRGSTRRRSTGDEDTVPLFEGQTVTPPSRERATPKTEPAPKTEAAPEAETAPKTEAAPRTEAAPSKERAADRATASTPSGSGVDLKALGLPTDPDAIVRYMTHRYKGVGEKTAETLVEQFGPDVFTVLRDDPERIKNAVAARRGEQVLEAWELDYERRTASRGAS